MNELESLVAAFVIDTFLLLLTGIGPKIALVPFLGATPDMPEPAKRRVMRKVLTTTAIVAALLLILGGLLTRLLHFSRRERWASPAASSCWSSGSPWWSVARSSAAAITRSRPGALMLVAVFPLAVPYLLNPAGISSWSPCRQRPAQSPCWLSLSV